MKCYFCGTKFNCDSDCPGVCRQAACLAKSDDAGLWKEFETAKLNHILGVMRESPRGPAYVHMTYADGTEEAYRDLGGEG